ncbi:DUF4435 domain-containing protein [Proteus mirabilis]|uniref:DUF4435 domain-containing protein n=2 Tax=Enterobacterales TaxID=91347 RepID=UPI002295208B|nr:DUF4435 domain-containing protein [Proteus mirabilis]MDC5894576.1 DUF4435 domain-containing protein [Proteus mirabilis]MDC5915710.1 DUF4435 domain-containing protein [Proteus mirabilis]MDC5926226.1 DUF4435 domain-containing protein [Proteus mirabilis]MDC6011212.1 DUF4435 domain-containing protein [Proteus mirabilis]MDC6021785.1 DUF4435 domain-containing protein [Proteus mirabilis]
MSEFDNLLKSARYLNAYTRQQTGKPQGVLFVENPSDRIFWENVIAHVCPNKYSVKAYSLDKAPGKRSFEKDYDKLHSSFIVGVDSDFDYLCPTRHDQAKALNENPFIIHTFVYSRESVVFNINSVNDISTRLVFRNRLTNDCIKALIEYSKIIFPALSVFSYAHNCDWQNFKEDQFMKAISLPENKGLLTDELVIDSAVFENIKISSERYIESILKNIGDEINKEYCCNIMLNRNITPETAYMYINGHYLKDNIIKPMLELLKYKNKSKDIENVKNMLPKDRWQQSINEINNHFKKCCHTESIIHNANSYTSGDIWNSIKSKLNQLVS